MPLYLALAAPVVAAAAYLSSGWSRSTRWLGAVAAGTVLLAGLWSRGTTGVDTAFDGRLRADSAAAYLLVVVGAVATLALAGWPQQLANEVKDHVLGPVTARWYGVFAMVTLAAAVTAATSSSTLVGLAAMAVLVVAIAGLVASRRKPAQKRAALVYGACCGGAVGLAAVGTLLPQGTTASTLTLLGWVTLAGLAPSQWWLPPTVSVATAPVSVLIAGVQIPVAIAAILRLEQPPRPVVLGVATASILVAALGALWQTDLRRLIAYTGIAGGGLAMAALAAATPQTAARLTLGIGLGAAALHLAAGHMVSLAGSGRIELTRGLLTRNPLLGTVFALGLFATAVLAPAVGYGRVTAGADEPLDTLAVGTGLVAVALFAAAHARRMLTGDPADRPDVTTGPARPLGSAAAVLVIAVAAAILAPFTP